MPIEISEIGIRMAVGPASPASPLPQPSAPGAPHPLPAAQLEELVEHCTRRVLLALKAQGDR